jgi:hypothetical protein
MKYFLPESPSRIMAYVCTWPMFMLRAMREMPVHAADSASVVNTASNSTDL